MFQCAKWFLIILLISSAHAQEDLEYPSGPDDYRSAFFAANYNGLGDTAYANWIEPGNEFCRVKFGGNCDQTEATPSEVAGARATWQAMEQCVRWRIRLHHIAELKWVHVTNPKIEIMYSTAIPAAKRTQIEACLIENVFEFMGLRFSVVCSKLDLRATDLCAKFWPGVPPNIPAKRMNPVVLGWEGDAE